MMNAWASFCTGGRPDPGTGQAWPQYHADGSVMMISEKWEAAEGYWQQDFNLFKSYFPETKILEGR